MSLAGRLKVNRRATVSSIYPVAEWCCDFCGQKFVSNNTRQIHIANEHSVNGSVDKRTESNTKAPIHSCQQCDFTTPSSVVLRNHELVHTYTKTCPHCPKKFFQDSHLKFHLATHSDHTKGSVPPRILMKANKKKVLMQQTKPAMETVLQKVEESPKRKKAKLEEEFLVESDTDMSDLLTYSNVKLEMLNDVYDETEVRPTTPLQEEVDPVIQSVCCDLEFHDLLTLLTHVHETHAKTFSATMSAMQPIVEETLQNKRMPEQDEVVFVQFQTDENGYSNVMYE